MGDDVRYETRGPVAIVTIDRPALGNAVDGPTATARAGSCASRSAA